MADNVDLEAAARAIGRWLGDFHTRATTANIVEKIVGNPDEVLTINPERRKRRSLESE
jgi:hypothetical protein